MLRCPCVTLGPLALLALAVAGPASSRQREQMEWSRAFWYNATDTKLPKVLLIGDSICDGYQSSVKDKLAGVANIGYWASSKCVSDPTYLKALDYFVGEYPYAVIHFNNGLHSLGSDRGEWEAGLRAAFALLRAKAPGAKVIWCSSTPLKDAALTTQAKELNAIAAKVVAELGLPTNDLFALMDPQDRAKLWSDTFHYRPAGVELEAKQVAESIRALLPAVAPATPTVGPAAGTNPVANGGFETADGWLLYPPKPEAGSLELVAEGAKAGARCAKVTAKAGGLQFYQHGPALVAGKTYELRFWAKADAAAQVKVHLRTQKPPYVFHGDKTVALTTDWQEFSTTATLPADYVPGAHVLFFNLSGQGTYWFDEVRAEAK